MNEYDSDRIADFVKKIDYIKTENIKDCDCYVINTCHIREKATEKVFHEVGRLKKEFKNKKKPILIITGCVAQAEGSLILEKEKYVDAVVGPQSYQNINSIIKDIEFKNKKIEFTEFEADRKFDQLIKLKNKRNKVSAFLTIQEGCDKFCKFCVVPYTRGPEISRPFKDILNERESLVENLNSVSFVSKIYPTDANFVLVKVDDATKRYNQLIEKGIVIRNRTSQPGCENCLRFTVGTQAENAKLIDVLNNLS